MYTMMNFADICARFARSVEPVAVRLVRMGSMETPEEAHITNVSRVDADTHRVKLAHPDLGELCMIVCRRLAACGGAWDHVYFEDAPEQHPYFLTMAL